MVRAMHLSRPCPVPRPRAATLRNEPGGGGTLKGGKGKVMIDLGSGDCLTIPITCVLAITDDTLT